MKNAFIPIWFATALTALALTDECDLLCDETFWETATKDSVLELVSAGADVNISDGLGGTPLHWAATAASGESVAALLSAGADINAKDEYDWTPLELAIFFGRAETVQVLWLAGAEVNTNAMVGWTALHLAALLGTPESIIALLSVGADGSLTNDDGETPFDLAQYNDNVRDTAAYWALSWSLNETVYD